MSQDILSVVLENVDSIGLLVGLFVISKLKFSMKYNKQQGFQIDFSFN